MEYYAKAATSELRVVRPLPKGTVVSYGDIEAVVMADTGGDPFTVQVEGNEQDWMWELDGIECHVVRYPVGYNPKANIVVSERMLNAAMCEAVDQGLIEPGSVPFHKNKAKMEAILRSALRARG